MLRVTGAARVEGGRGCRHRMGKAEPLAMPAARGFIRMIGGRQPM